jgi:hypothetical protein
MHDLLKTVGIYLGMANENGKKKKNKTGSKMLHGD